jgi:4-alpha-glucanotransferase
MSDAGRPVDLIPFAPEYRASGVLLHVSSLPSLYGIGDWGPAAWRQLALALHRRNVVHTGLRALARLDHIV